MHTRELVELAAILAAHGPARIRSGQPFGESGLRQYWSAARCRFDRWASALKAFQAATSAVSSSLQVGAWERVSPVLAEVLSSEILTRVWTAVGCGTDRLRGSDEAAPILLNVLAGHLEARHRVLSLLVAGRGVRLEQAVSVNRLRRMTERWTDLLLSHLADACPVGRFAHRLRRVRDYAADVSDSRDPEAAWAVLIACLRTWLRPAIPDPSANPDLNRQLADGILACLPAESFAASGLPKSCGWCGWSR